MNEKGSRPIADTRSLHALAETYAGVAARIAHSRYVAPSYLFGQLGANYVAATDGEYVAARVGLARCFAFCGLPLLCAMVRGGGMPLAGLFRHVRLVVRLVELTGADASEDVCNDLHDAVRAIVETTTGIARERGLNSDTIMNLISETRWFDRVGD